MKLRMYSVYDSKAECFGTPFFMGSRGLAVRAFTDLVNDVKSSINRHPEDYTLFEIGSFDDNKAVFEPLFAPESLGIATGFLLKEKEVVSVEGTPFFNSKKVIVPELNSKE